jgi:hypothetical protein
MFTSILSGVEGSLTIQNALICTAVSLVLGIFIAFIYMKQGSYSKNFVITLAILPVLVQVVIMLVNGNVGTSVAVLGTFSLVRFRSIPGTARDIVSIFFSMAIGLATGMGFLSFAAIMTVITGCLFLLLSKSGFGDKKNTDKDLRITIAENLDYTEIFEDIFEKYTAKCSLMQVKTTNLGSMYELDYHIELKDEKQEKSMIDELRCRNGNLRIICGRRSSTPGEL